MNVILQPDLPLSAIQESIFADQWMSPGSTRYNVPIGYRLEGALNVEALRRAVEAMVARHEILRTTYVLDGGQAVQAIAGTAPDVFRIIEEPSAGAVGRILEEQARHVFDLSRELPVRATLVVAAGRPAAFTLVFHHVAVDGWSVRLLLDGLAQDYNSFLRGEPSRVAEPELQYADWGAWLQEELQAQGAAAADRVVSRIEAVAADLDLPARPAGQAGNENGADMLTFEIAPSLAARAEQTCKAHGISLYGLFAAAYGLVLSRLGDRQSVPIGVPVALRDRSETHATAGCFINTAVICLAAHDSMRKAQYLGATRAAVIAALDDRDVPLPAVYAASQARGRKLDLRCFFSFDDAEITLPRLEGVTLTPVDLDRGSAKFDFGLAMVRSPAGLRGAFDIAAGILPEQVARSLPQRFSDAVAWLCDGTDAPLAAYALTGEAEARDLLALGRGPAAEVPQASVDAAIFAVAARLPQTTAIASADGEMSFSAYTAAAAAFAAQLARAGIGRDHRVIVSLPRGAMLMVAMLGILRSGAAYVPVDIAMPQMRLRDIAEDAAAAAVICMPEQADAMRALLGAAVTVIMPAGTGFEVGHGARPPLAPAPARPGDLAYMIYTSGSTGKPKGVMVPHQGLLNYLTWAAAAYDVAGGTGSPVVTSTAFDATLLSFWCPLLVGKPVVLLPESGAIETLAEQMADGRRFSFVKMTPAHLDLLPELRPVDAQRDGAHVFVVGGEALKSASVALWHDKVPGLRIINEYGPTETVVGCAVHEVAQRDLGLASIPIGKAIDNTFLYVLDSQLRLRPRGLVGELYIGGNSVSWGYWNRRGLTAERFIADPYSPVPGARMYRSGDLVRFNAHGELEYLSRSDDQVKVRGFRIEPGEVEAALRGIAGVTQAAVVAIGPPGGVNLMGFISGDASAAHCRQELARMLPSYMVPQHIERLAAIPLTVNGKIDRAQLARLAAAAPGPGADDTAAPAPAASGPEATLTALWQEVLKHKGATAETDFFAAGGNSLDAIRLIARINRAFAASLDFAQLAAHPSPRRLAAAFSLHDPAPWSLAGVIALFQDLLPPGRIDADTDFFAAGGTSLSSIRAVARIKRAAGYETIANDLVFAERTPRRIAAALAAAMRAERAAAPAPRALPPQERPRASPGETQLWLEQRLSPEASPYVMQIAWRMPGRYTAQQIDAAIAAVAGRHPVMRTAYAAGDGTGPDSVAVSLLAESPVRCVPAGAAGGLEAIARQDAGRPFDLARGHSFRLTALEDGAATVLLLSLHHIISDATTLALLYRDVCAALEGHAGAAPPAADYRSYAAWRWRETAAVAQDQLARWQKILEGAPAQLPLPLDHPRRQGHRPSGASHELAIAPALLAAIEAYARARACTVHTVLVAAYAVLLNRLSGGGDLVIGVPVNDRPEGFEQVAGLFLNTLPLRLAPGEAQGFDDLVAQTRQAMAELIRLRDVPFAEIVKAVNPERELGRTPLLHTVFDWRDDAGGTTAGAPASGAEVLPLPVSTAPFDIALSATRLAQGGLLAGFIYDAALLDPVTVAAWSRCYETILAAAVADGARAISTMPALAGQDLGRAVLHGPPPAASHDLDHVLRASFSAHAPLLAISSGGTRLTYADLLARAMGAPPVAGHLAIIETADPLARVVAALSAILHGKAFALLDPSLPPPRLAAMRETLAKVPADSRLAYVQFTSGSTGTPKAAMLHRAGLANLAQAISRDLRIRPGSRLLQLASPGFDAWMWEVFPALAGGATLVLAERASLQAGRPLARTMAGEAVSHVTITPSALAAIGRSELPQLEVIVSAGEPLSAELVRMWSPGRMMVNAYGPCETTVCATHGLCRADEEFPDIGTPIAGMSVRIVDRNGQPVLPGAAGELCIEGVGVGLGYAGDDIATAGKFHATATPGVRLYRSGDMARVRSDGHIQFIGRDDRQVKVRGVRIEMDEVELALRGVDGVTDAAVKTVPGPDGMPILAAWVQLAGGVDAGDVRTRLAAHLPETMLPSFVIPQAAFPLTATGKIDRSKLSVPREQQPGTAEQPANAAETAVAEVFRDLLSLTALPGRLQNFFTLGGHSILAVKLADRLERMAGRQIPLGVIFARPTPAALAEQLAARDEAPVRLRNLRDGAEPAVFLVHAVDGTCKAYEPLAAAWPGGRRVVAVEQGAHSDSLAARARAYAAAIGAAAGAKNPMFIAGWSLGATIAAAVTQQLRGEGRDVRLVLIDAAVPRLIADKDSIERDIAAAAETLGANSPTVLRVRENVSQTYEHRLARAKGPAGLIIASRTPRDGLPGHLGWGDVFSHVEARKVDATHQTIVREGDLAALAAMIESLWDLQAGGAAP